MKLQKLRYTAKVSRHADCLVIADTPIKRCLGAFSVQGALGVGLQVRHTCHIAFIQVLTTLLIPFCIGF